MSKRDKIARRRIRRGIIFLDAQKSGWREEINLETFKMNHEEHCILGQVFGSYTPACESLGIDQDIAAHMGFVRTKRVGWKRLSKMWRKALKAELTPA